MKPERWLSGGEELPHGLPCCLGEVGPVSGRKVGLGGELGLHGVMPQSNLRVLPGGTRSLGHDRPDEVAPLIVEHLR